MENNDKIEDNNLFIDAAKRRLGDLLVEKYLINEYDIKYMNRLKLTNPNKINQIEQNIKMMEVRIDMINEHIKILEEKIYDNKE